MHRGHCLPVSPESTGSLTATLHGVSRLRGPTQIREIDGRSQGKGGVTRSASEMRDEETPGPLTQASAPTGVPAKSQISWGGLAPGRLGRVEARLFGVRRLSPQYTSSLTTSMPG